MKKKLALMTLLILVINLIAVSVSFAADVDFPWSIKPPIETTTMETSNTP